MAPSPTAREDLVTRDVRRRRARRRRVDRQVAAMPPADRAAAARLLRDARDFTYHHELTVEVPRRAGRGALFLSGRPVSREAVERAASCLLAGVPGAPWIWVGAPTGEDRDGSWSIEITERGETVARPRVVDPAFARKFTARLALLFGHPRLAARLETQLRNSCIRDFLETGPRPLRARRLTFAAPRDADDVVAFTTRRLADLASAPRRKRTR